MSELDSNGDEDTSGHPVRTALVCGAILLAAGAAAAAAFATEPTAKRGGATKETAMLVDVVEVERGTYRPAIIAVGTVTPARDVQVTPQVSGEVIARAQRFEPGSRVAEGDVLVRLQPADFRLALRQRQTELRQAETALEIEMGRQDVAEGDYALFDGELPPEKKDLVLRKPQLEAARVRVDSARAAVEQARLNLRRATVRAPFDAHILSRTVDVGSRVAPGDTLGRLVGLSTYWVAVSLPLSKLRWNDVPETARDEGSPATIRNRSAWPEGAVRHGTVSRVVGALDPTTRMARVLVTIPDPLARSPEAAEPAPALMVGEFVETRIDGRALSDVVRLSREYVRDEDTAWVMVDGALQIRSLDLAMRDDRHAYVRSGLESGDLVVTTGLATVTEGASLRLRPDAGADAAARSEVRSE